VEDPERWASPVDLAATVPDRRRGGLLTREAAGRFDYVVLSDNYISPKTATTSPRF